VVGDADEYVGEPGLRIGVVHFAGDDQAIHGRRPLTPAIGSTEQPGLSTQGDATKSALSGVVREADAAVVYPFGEHRGEKVA
jgi:hypothetical protein